MKIVLNYFDKLMFVSKIRMLSDCFLTRKHGAQAHHCFNSICVALPHFKAEILCFKLQNTTFEETISIKSETCSKNEICYYQSMPSICIHSVFCDDQQTVNFRPIPKTQKIIQLQK